MKKVLEKIDRDLDDKLSEAEALANLMIRKAEDLKKYCHRTRAKMEGAKTPSRRKAALSFEQKMDIIAKRNKRIGNL